MDNADIINKHKNEIEQQLVQAIKDDTSMKLYKEANFSFAYLLRSAKNPRKVYFQTTITPKKYKQ